MEGHTPLDHGQSRGVNSYMSSLISPVEPLRSVKKEMGAGPEYGALGLPFLRDPSERFRCLSPEAEAGEWIRDEPVESCGSSPSFSSEKYGSLGNLDTDGKIGSLCNLDTVGKMYAVGMNSNISVPVSRSSPSVVTSTGSPGRLPDLTEHAAGSFHESGNPSLLREMEEKLYSQIKTMDHKMSLEEIGEKVCSQIQTTEGKIRYQEMKAKIYGHIKLMEEKFYSQIKTIRIKENVMQGAIRRLGGGQKGLQGLIIFILLYLKAKNTAASSQGTEQFTREPLVSPSLEELQKLNLNQGGFVGNGFDRSPEDGGENNGSRCNGNGDMQVLMNSGCADAVLHGFARKLDEDSSESSKNHDKEVVGVNELGTLSGILEEMGGVNELGPLNQMLEDIGMEELGVQGSMTSLETQSVAVNVSNFIPEETRKGLGIRRRSPSPDPTSLCMDRLEEFYRNHEEFHRNKNRFISPPGHSSKGSCEVSAYPSNAQSLPEAMSYSHPFPTFSMSPPSPNMDHHMEMGTFSSFGVQGTGLFEEKTMGGTAGMYSVDSTMEREQSGARLGLGGKSKAIPAAHTRLARKNRMDRNRRPASYHFSRSPQSGSTPGGVNGTGWGASSPSASSRTPRSQSVPRSEEQSKVRDRRNMDTVRYLLQKMLKPSDVGNLGRIVLPKKDAESHLPWLGAREGIPLPAEDFDTGDKLNLRYRFWPNNKSRMYLLENTGDFIKKHKLEEGDRLMIYKNLQDDSFIIRARKAQDCVDLAASQVHMDDKEARGKEISSQGPPVSGSSSATSSGDMDGGISETPLESAVSRQEEEPASGVTSVTLITSQDDLFADLPDAPMGHGTEPLVRFPSLEAFDELLAIVPAVLSKQQQEDGRVTKLDFP